jgi:hypothetical protein
MRIDIESIGIDPVRLRLVLMNVVKIFGLVLIGIATSAPPRSFAAEQASDVPTWLGAHVGEGEGQIAQVVLQRARALSSKKCARLWLETHATSPWTLPVLTI